MGVSIRIAGEGSIIEIDSGIRYPLASVYKVPLLATLFHKASEGAIDLDRRLTLRDLDKALGSGDLQYFVPGIRLTVRDLAYLMIVHSDNTATDMLHHLLGLDAPNRFMRELGLESVDIHCPNREYFLLLLGYDKRFRGMTMEELVSTWRTMSRAARVSAYARLRKDTALVTHAEARSRALEMWGVSDEKERAIDRIASEVMDNLGSPADMSRLLELMVGGAIADKDLTDSMMDMMSLCDSRERLPAKIPEGVRVANKTGTVPGTVDDCAVIFPRKKPPLICTCLTKSVKHKDVKTVEEAISDIGSAAYELLGR